MPLTLAHLKKNTRTLTLTYAGEEVNVTYRPGAMTPALSLEMADPATNLPVVTVLEQTLVSWDVLDDDLTPLPVTHDTLIELPSDFLSVVFSALMEDFSVGKPSGATSGAG